ncbi:MAG TPA: YtxH domain-containing protein [Bacteroidales bacterium]|nr:YtxH domain-containing protein [Bacteroidales bacterium]
MRTSGIVISLIAGVIAGAAAGAILGVLYAPDRGVETRRKISHKGEELRDNLKQKFESVKEDTRDLIDKGKSKIYEAKNDVNTSSI